MDMSAWQRAEREFVQDPAAEDAAIAGVHSVSRDGETLTVYCDLLNGRTRIYTFTAGRPMAYVDHDV